MRKITKVPVSVPFLKFQSIPVKIENLPEFNFYAFKDFFKLKEKKATSRTEPRYFNLLDIEI